MIRFIFMRRPAAATRTPSSVRRLAAMLFASAVGTFLSATPLQGQSVRGTLLDEERGRPVPGARLYLLEESGAAVDSTFTDEAGRYQLDATRAGTHVIHFQMDGWAGAGSEPLVLGRGVAREYDFPVVLVSNAAMRQMSDMIRMDERLQTSLPEVCGEALRPWEAGLLVGTVRARATNAPAGGVRVAVSTAERGVTRATVSTENGIYILCNVPLGGNVAIITTTPDGVEETTDVEIRAGMVSWYDLRVGPRR